VRSPVPPSLLEARAVVGAGVDGWLAEVVRGLGAGRRLVRRLFIALAGRVVRRAIGLSSREELLPSSAIVTRQEEPGVLADDDECINVGPLGGVAGA
jgi:hypothetical protein